MNVVFNFEVGQMVRVRVLPGAIEGYVDSCAVNQTGGIIYFVITTSKATSSWYAEDFIEGIDVG